MPLIADIVRRSLGAFTNVLECSGDKGLKPFIDDLRGLNPATAKGASDRPKSNPALAHLPKALSSARGDQRLVDAVRAIAGEVRWASSYAPGGKVGFLATRMVWGEIAGQRGLIKAPLMRHGCFLLSPGLVYPLHGHVAEEIYFVTSGRMEVEHGLEGARVCVGPGEYYHTPPGHPHALHIGEDPVLIVYQWTGDLAPPVWFLECDNAGAWTRFHPEFQRG